MLGNRPSAMQLLSQTHGTPRKMRSGGAVHGPGTGTSDSIPALLSNGEYVLPADTVQAVGRPALDALRSLTHMPVQKFADGGLVDDPLGAGAVTRSGNSYSGMDVRGNISVNGQPPAGTYNENVTGGAAAALAAPPRAAAPDTQSAGFVRPDAAAAPAGQPPVAGQPSAAAPAAQSGWAERNAQRNLEVTASSIMASPQRAAAQAALRPAATAPVPTRPGMPSAALGAADSAPAPSAAAQLSTLPTSSTSTFRPRQPAPTANMQDRPATTIPRFADGGAVDEEALRRAQAAGAASLVGQIPTDGQRPAPVADGSQSNPLNTEIGRNALNTLAALPGAAGLGARAGGVAARGAAGAGGALSTERVIPAAWEVVQEGGALARTGQEAGTLSRAASTAIQQQPSMAGNAAQLLSAPPSRAVAERTASAVGEAAPQFARRPSGPVPWADVVEPAALAAQQASPAASAASNLAGANLGRAVGAGAGLGGAVVAGTALDASSGSAGQVAGGSRPAEPGAPGERVIPPGGGAAQALSSVPEAIGGANVTRVGNSYSGPANISGDITINGQAPRSAAEMLGAMPAGQISAQNMAAADALAQREQAASLARLGLGAGPAQAGWSGEIGQSSGYGNMWSRTPEQQRRDAEVSASSIHRPTAARGAAALQALDMQDLQQVRNQGEMAVAGLQGRNALSRTMLENQGAMDRQALQTAGTVQAAQLRSGQAPKDYRWTAAGTLEPIPGSAAAVKAAEDQKTKDAALDGSRQAIGTINRLLTSPGREGATGTWNLSRFWPGSQEADFAAEVETLKAQTFLPMVQQLRGMGALSNAEGDKLNAAVGALNFNMSEKAFANSLGRIRDQIASAMQKSGVDTKDVANWGLANPSSVGEQPVPAPGGRAQAAAPANTPAAQESPQIAELRRRAAGNPALAARLQELGY